VIHFFVGKSHFYKELKFNDKKIKMRKIISNFTNLVENLLDNVFFSFYLVNLII
jgi:hypothetical protein